MLGKIHNIYPAPILVSNNYEVFKKPISALVATTEVMASVRMLPVLSLLRSHGIFVIGAGVAQAI
jgi:hypothetical protein